MLHSYLEILLVDGFLSKKVTNILLLCMNLNCGVCCSPYPILNFNVSFRELLTSNAQKEKLRYEAENGKLKDEERRLKQELAFLQKEMSSIGKINLHVYH